MVMIFKILFTIITMISFTIAEDINDLDQNAVDEIKVEKLPDIILKDLDNKKVSISDLIESRPTLISFWFLACEPCKKEMKYLDEFNKKYAESGFQVISINTDGSRAFSSVEPFIDSKKYSFKVLSDPRSKYQRKLKGASCPFTVMVDHKGNIVGVAVALMSAEAGQNIFFAVKSSTLKTFANANGITFLKPSTQEMSNAELGQLITEGTLFLECWMTIAKIKQIIAQEENRKAFYSEFK